MSSEIFYDKAFIRVGEKYIPVVNHGSSNCFDFDFDGREVPEKHWSVLNYPHRNKMLFTADEMQEIADTYEAASMDNYGGTRKSRNRPFEEGEFRRWILAGMKSAYTVEDYGKFGNKVVIIDYDDDRWQKHPVATTDALLEKIQELEGHSITVSFWDNRYVNHPSKQNVRKRQTANHSSLPGYYVLRAEKGYFVKRSNRHIWFAERQKPQAPQVRKFKTEAAARKYLADNQKFLSRFAFEVEHVQNGGAKA